MTVNGSEAAYFDLRVWEPGSGAWTSRIVSAMTKVETIRRLELPWHAP